MTKKKLKCEFSDKEIESWVQEFRRACKEYPDPNEEKFPSNPEDIHAHINLLEELIKKNPTQELKVELRVYRAVLSGAFIGHSVNTEALMRASDDIQHTSYEDKKVNQLSNNKIFKFLNKEKETNPEKMISKKKMLQVARLTKKELLDAGIENVDRYIHAKPKDENS